MTDKPTGGPAFPRSDSVSNSNSGMTLRDWFAGQALAGSSRFWLSNGAHDVDMAEWSYEIADAMMEARK